MNVNVTNLSTNEIKLTMKQKNVFVDLFMIRQKSKYIWASSHFKEEGIFSKGHKF